MNNITWTDSDAGRTFWKFNEDTQEWEKSFFMTWDELRDSQKHPKAFSRRVYQSSVSPPKGG